MEDAGEDITVVLVEPHDELRPALRAAEDVDARPGQALGTLDVEELVERPIRRQDVGQQCGQQNDRQQAEPDDSGPLAQDLAERVAPQACGGRHGTHGAAGGGHRSRIRGSRYAYETSTMRLITTYRTAITMVKAWMTM